MLRKPKLVPVVSALRKSYDKFCQDCRSNLLSMSFTNWPEDPTKEIQALMYTVIQIAVSLAGDKAKSIIEAFIIASPSLQEMENLLVERSDEYWNALKIDSGTEGLYRLGKVFAGHTQRQPNPGVILVAATHFKDNLAVATKIVKKDVSQAES